MTAPAPLASGYTKTTKESHPDLPVGTVLGPDGKPCKACNTFASMSGFKMKKPKAAGVVVDRSSCPPDKDALGRATWTFLHTTAAYYPTNPSPQHQSHMRGLLSSIPQLYPCTWCADDFGKDLAANPPDVSSRTALSRWLCERHNEVNTKLGKEKFECTWEKLDARWKDGPKDGSCD